MVFPSACGRGTCAKFRLLPLIAIAFSSSTTSSLVCNYIQVKSANPDGTTTKLFTRGIWWGGKNTVDRFGNTVTEQQCGSYESIEFDNYWVGVKALTILSLAFGIISLVSGILMLRNGSGSLKRTGFTMCMMCAMLQLWTLLFFKSNACPWYE